MPRERIGVLLHGFGHRLDFGRRVLDDDLVGRRIVNADDDVVCVLVNHELGVRRWQAATGGRRNIVSVGRAAVVAVECEDLVGADRLNWRGVAHWRHRPNAEISAVRHDSGFLAERIIGQSRPELETLFCGGF
jgi:hypothetical protein